MIFRDDPALRDSSAAELRWDEENLVVSYNVSPGDTRDEVCRKIGRAYRELGHRTGWTFMMCPEGRLPRARVVLVGLNPGGGPCDMSKPNGGYDEAWSCEDGNNCWVGNWKIGYPPGKAPLTRVPEAHGRADALL